MIEGLMSVWAAEALEEIKSLLEQAGRTGDEHERAYLEARIREQKERRAALGILKNRWK